MANFFGLLLVFVAIVMVFSRIYYTKSSEEGVIVKFDHVQDNVVLMVKFDDLYDVVMMSPFQAQKGMRVTKTTRHNIFGAIKVRYTVFDV